MSTKLTLKRFLISWTPPIIMRWRRRIIWGRMDRELPAHFYDANLRNARQYLLPYWQSPYYGIWTVVADRVARHGCAHVLEIGCGTGQLAELVVDNARVAAYEGFDFSEARIRIANDRGLSNSRFHIDDAYTTALLNQADYDCVICTEVLEHIDDDLGILSRIRQGVRVLATVPDFPADGHVRYFRNASDVETRYGPYFVEMTMTEMRNAGGATLFLLDGVRAAADLPAGESQSASAACNTVGP
jgi:SAM-dependent methyltransferase